MMINHVQNGVRHVARRAFSLIELVLVIAIIALLAAILLGVGPAILGKAEVSRTEDAMKLADMAIREWVASSGSDEITWGTGEEEDQLATSFQFDLQWRDSGGTLITPDLQLQVLFGRMMTNDACREILSKIDEDFLRPVYDTNDPTIQIGYELVDAWENPVFLIHPGRKPRTDFPFDDGSAVVDEDGTIYVNEDYAGANGGYEERYGVCKNRRILLVSAGPDGNFGDPLSGDEFTREQVADNVYSYDPIQPYQP